MTALEVPALAELLFDADAGHRVLLGQVPPGGGDQDFWQFGPYFVAFVVAMVVWRTVRWVRAKRQDAATGGGPDRAARDLDR